MKKIVVSGGFDPVHIGHLRLFVQAKKIGDHLTVILNSDDFLLEKKGFLFMPFEERKEILLGFSAVDTVFKSIDEDNTVVKSKEKLAQENSIDVFANGGDRKNIEDIPEYEICRNHDIEMIFDIGGDKIQSSSNLVYPFLNYKEERPWGKFENLTEDENFLVKKLTVKPNQKLSLQYHNKRSEYWVIVEGKGLITLDDKETICEPGSSFFIDKKKKHRIENLGSKDLIIIEVQMGTKLSEGDIVRIEDIYGRN